MERTLTNEDDISQFITIQPTKQFNIIFNPLYKQATHHFFKKYCDLGTVLSPLSAVNQIPQLTSFDGFVQKTFP